MNCCSGEGIDMRLINVDYHHEDGSWWAESDDVPGFTAAAATFAKLRELTAEGIKFYLGDEDFALDEHLDGARLTSNWRFDGPMYQTHVVHGSVATLLPAVAGRRDPVPA